MSYASDTKYFDEMRKLKKTCKHCGHTQVMHFLQKKTICRWCKHYIFKNDFEEFKHNLKQQQIKERRNMIYER